MTCADEDTAVAAVSCCPQAAAQPEHARRRLGWWQAPADQDARPQCRPICASDPSGAPPLTLIDGQAATYREAAHECHAQGMRLCEPLELVHCCGCAGTDPTVNRHTWSIELCSRTAPRDGAVFILSLMMLCVCLTCLRSCLIWIFAPKKTGVCTPRVAPLP